uniref:UDP-glycosyltransferase 92A1-like n=1 Tax=Nicotiana tabacum TaxID=4097 RepID=A0A1S4B6V4_TOBAC|nr:PREDICTED: UDP-glycosyltransferase 92A1-like [Nicotiana tabacum]
MAQGHFIPFLALALKLEQEKGYSITFITTSLNIMKRRPSIPPHSFIRLLEIPYDCTFHGLPPNTESTENLPLSLFIRFLESTPSLKPAFTKIMSNLFLEENCSRPPLCVISDMFFSWTAKIAHTFGIFHVIFNAGGCFEPMPFPQTMFQEWLETDGMLFNTVEDMDLMGLDYYKKQFPCPIWTIGPIVSSFGSKARAGKSSEAESISKICANYLDSKSPNSVLYVAFDSQLMKALTNGVPILGWPMGVKQSFNAKMLEEDLKVCVRIMASGVVISSDIKHKEIVRKIEIL